MLDPADIRQLVNLPPEDAIRFLDAKGYRTSVRWTDTWQDEHAAAFTVAKVAQIDLLREIHVSLIDAMATGQTFERWQAELRPKLAAAGWWGRFADPDLTGTDETITVGPRRLRTIYDTNLRMARATALWGRIVASRESLPFLRYSAVMDRRTRPQHRLWHDIVLPVEHPFWQTHFPPNGWNCRCTVVQLSARALERRGLAITTEAELDARGFGATPVPFWRKGSEGRPGQIEQVPPGIDPGFAYNPGTARARLVLEKAADSLARAASVPGLIEPALADIMETLPGGRPDQARVNAMIALARAGQVAELAAMLAELLGVVTAAAGLDDIETAARGGKRGGKKAGVSAKLSEIAASRKRDGGGRFAEEGIKGQRPLTPEQYEDLAKGPPGNFIVIGKLDKATARLMGVKDRAIRLSGEEASKHFNRRKYIQPGDFATVAPMLNTGRLYRDRGNFVAHAAFDGRAWHVAVHPTGPGELYLKSLRRTDTKNMAAIAARSILVRE